MNRRGISWLCALGAGLTASAALWPAPAAAEGDLSGRWVMAQLSVTVAEVPVVGKIYASTRTVTLHDLDHDGDRLHGPGELCQLELDSGSTFVSTKLPKAFKRSLPRPSFDARVGTCAALVASACTTCESAWSDRLMHTASFCASPTEPLFFSRSDPARSTTHSLPASSPPPPTRRWR